MEILRPRPACAQDFRFPSAPGKPEGYFTGRDSIPAFPSFRGTDRSRMEEARAAVMYLASPLGRQVQGLLPALQVSDNVKDGDSRWSQ